MAAVFRRSLSLQKGVQCLSTLKPSVSRTAVPLLSPARPLIRGPFRCQLHTSPSRRERAEVPLATKEEPPLTEASSLVTELPPLPKSPSSSGAPSFAFAFDIDGVLLHSATPYGPAIPMLHHLRTNSVPFMLLTNGGGRTEQKYADRLSTAFDLEPKISPTEIVQSHTPFKLISTQNKLPAAADPYVPGGRELKSTNGVLLIGGGINQVRMVAREYGFHNGMITNDLLLKTPTVWPFREVTKTTRRYGNAGRVKDVDAIFVFADSNDWGMDIQIILDYIIPPVGTDFSKNPPPPLIFSNPDLVWSSAHPTPRLGQGAFRAALEGAYRRIVEATRPDLDPQMKYYCIGKPSQETYEYAEDQLVRGLAKGEDVVKEDQLKTVYMIGDNPLSDIQGANGFKSKRGVEWVSILVESGVYKPGDVLPEGGTPQTTVKDVYEGVQWALNREGWKL